LRAASNLVLDDGPLKLVPYVAMNAVLHYIYDPLCGWCYGAEPLVWAASRVDGLALTLHAGGLWPQPTRLPEHMRRYIQQADARVGQMSGQPYGEPYLNGLLFDPDLVLESRPVIGAVLAAQILDPNKALPMLRGIQHAHYERGQHVVRDETLREVAAEIGLDVAAFTAALKTVPVDEHLAASRQLMNNVGAQGFPTFVLQIGDEWLAVPHGRFASAPAKLAEWLEAQLRARSRTH
jgi:putative protein-disulfide isomerase